METRMNRTELYKKAIALKSILDSAESHIKELAKECMLSPEDTLPYLEKVRQRALECEIYARDLCEEASK